MNSDEYWSDWSDVNYIEWEDLEKVYVAEKIPHSNSNENPTDSDVESNLTGEMSAAEDTSEWSSDDDRWEMNLQQLEQQERCRRIDAILKSSEWNNTEEMDIQNIGKIAKVPIFPLPSSSEDEDKVLLFKDTNLNEDQSVSESDKSSEIKDNNDTSGMNDPKTECFSEEIISTSDEYVPTKNDINSSDSNSCINLSEETSDGFEEVVSKKRRKYKKKQKRLFASKSDEQVKEVLNRNSCASQTEVFKTVKQQSLSEYSKRREVNRNHSRRLDVLLKSNGLRRQYVPAVGNCFFEALSRQTTEKTNATTLRQQLCQHIEENAKYYGEFLNSAEDNLNHEIELLRQEDNWQNSLSDAMPLATANLLGVTVKIYSSNPDQPVVVVTPSLTETNEKQEVTLCYLCVAGHEHYDSVKKRTIGLPSETESELEICDDQDCTSNTADITIEYSNERGDDDTADTPTKAKESSLYTENITPRKQAKYQSPKRKRLTRKKKANPENWKKNIRKIKCQSGMEYESVTGKTVKARSIKEHYCSKCRFGCADKVSEEERLSLFNDYWNLKSYERQRDYICSRVLERDSIGSPTKKRKQVARTFTFNVNGHSIRVCKMFLQPH